MHEVILISLRGRLKVFVDGSQMFLYGELKPVPDEDKNWQRITNNLNVSPQEISLLLLCDKTTDELLMRVTKFFSGVSNFRLTDLRSVTEIIAALHDTKAFIFCGCATRFGENGDWQCGFTDDFDDTTDMRKLSFANVFSFLPAVATLKKEFGTCQRNFARVNNKLKSLQKKAGK